MTTEIVKEYGVGKSRTRHGFYLAAALIAIGAWVLFLAGDSVPDRFLTGIGMCGLGAAVGGYAWWMGQQVETVLRVDRTGIWYKEWGVAVPWSGIRDILHTGHKLQPYVTIHLSDPEAFLESLSADEVRGLKGNRLWKSPYIRIPNGAVDARQADLLDIFRKMLALYR